MKVACARCGGPTRHKNRRVPTVHVCRQILGACGVEVTDPPRRGKGRRLDAGPKVFLWKTETLDDGSLTADSKPEHWHHGGAAPTSPFPSAHLAHSIFADSTAREVRP